jgi:cytoskeletal protein RodZ
MVKFGEELQLYRQKKNISLQEISAATRINIRFLDAIERGDFTILPLTYMRAMLREYASYLDLDPNEVIQAFDRVYGARPSDVNLGAPPLKPEPTPPFHPLKTAPDTGLPREPIFSKGIRQIIQVPAFSIGLAFVVVVGVVIFFLLRNSGSHEAVKETPFDQVAKENEARLSPAPAVTTADAAQRPDSLELRAKTNDTVWIQIRSDTGQARDMILAPNASYVWKAKQRFNVTVGNAGGITFTLNGKPIGQIGKKGVVVRDFEFNRSRLRY